MANASQNIKIDESRVVGGMVHINDIIENENAIRERFMVPMYYMFIITLLYLLSLALSGYVTTKHKQR